MLTQKNLDWNACFRNIAHQFEFRMKSKAKRINRIVLHGNSNLWLVRMVFFFWFKITDLQWSQLKLSLNSQRNSSIYQTCCPLQTAIILAISILFLKKPWQLRKKLILKKCVQNVQRVTPCTHLMHEKLNEFFDCVAATTAAACMWCLCNVPDIASLQFNNVKEIRINWWHEINYHQLCRQRRMSVELLNEWSYCDYAFIAFEYFGSFKRKLTCRRCLNVLCEYIRHCFDALELLLCLKLKTNDFRIMASSIKIQFLHSFAEKPCCNHMSAFTLKADANSQTQLRITNFSLLTLNFEGFFCAQESSCTWQPQIIRETIFKYPSIRNEYEYHQVFMLTYQEHRLAKWKQPQYIPLFCRILFMAEISSKQKKHR